MSFLIRKKPNKFTMGLFSRILLSFLVAIIPIFTVGYLIVSNGEKALKEEILNSLDWQVHFYMNEFTREVEHIMNLKLEYVFDQQIQQFSIMSEIYSDYERRVKLLDIQKKIRTLKSSSSYIKDVRLYLLGEQKIVTPNTIRYSIPEHNIDIQALVDSQIYPIAVWDNQLMFIERFPLSLNTEDQPLYWIEIDLDEKKVTSVLNSMLGYNDGLVVLSDINLDWMVISNEEKASNILGLHGQPTGDDNEYLLASRTSSNLGIALNAYILEEEILQPLTKYTKWYKVLNITAAVIIILFAYWVNLFFKKPIYQLVNAFRKVKGGDFNVTLKRNKNDEIGFLYNQFNRMVQMIQHLIKDVYEHEIRWKQAELKHLQAQINPHFLYNTYYRLHRLAQDEDTENIKLYSLLLGDYMKYITRNTYDDTTLGQEYAHAKTYIDIQKMRFGNKIALEWSEMPKELAQTKVPRLILQPIVENAFIYGLEEMDSGGILKCYVIQKNQTVSVVIEDNGEQLSVEQLDQLQYRLSKHTRDIETTGLLNVHRRLQLKFGAAYGLYISRSNMGGLYVEVRMPTEEVTT